MEKRLKNIWKNMNYRCSNKKNKNYGKRGITVCDQWKTSFPNFMNWAMKNGYKENLQIDRKDNDGNYEPSNCRWVTAVEQSANRRVTRKIEYKSKFYTTRQFAKKFNLSQNCVNNRVKKGWDVERIISTHEKKNNKKFKFKGEQKTLMEISKETGLKYDTLHQRIFENGMTLNEAVTKKVRQLYKFKGEELTLPVIAKKASIHVESIRGRMKNFNMTVEESVDYLQDNRRG